MQVFFDNAAFCDIVCHLHFLSVVLIQSSPESTHERSSCTERKSWNIKAEEIHDATSSDLRIFAGMTNKAADMIVNGSFMY